METLFINLVVVLGAMFVLWILSVLFKDTSIVDPFWGLGFSLVAWTSCWVNWPGTTRLWLICMLVTIWALRLSGHLFWRNWGEAEDPRYVVMRKKHGARFWWVSFFTVFLLQGVLLWLIAFPIQSVALAGEESEIGWLDFLGVAVWINGFIFETIGDWQLATFRADPANRGKVLDTGLWRYTRHPNYFGDFCVWWGLYLIAVSGGGAWTFFSPLVMTFLLLKVSGVTLLEKGMGQRRPDYEEYKRRTNAFFPGLPKDDLCNPPTT
jgi:steroid 5-alpha reductase family enzyme